MGGLLDSQAANSIKPFNIRSIRQSGIISNININNGINNGINNSNSGDPIVSRRADLF